MIFVAGFPNKILFQKKHRNKIICLVIKKIILPPDFKLTSASIFKEKGNHLYFGNK